MGTSLDKKPPLVSVKMSLELRDSSHIESSEMATDDMKIAALRAVNRAIRRYRRHPNGESTDLQFEADVEEAMDAHDNYTQKVWKCSHFHFIGDSVVSTIHDGTVNMERRRSRRDSENATWLIIALPTYPTDVRNRWLWMGK